MAVIAIWSLKGGVGKTTIAGNLAWYSACISKRSTLLWDLDATGGAAFLLNVEPPPSAKIAKTVFDANSHPAKLVRHTAYDRLDVLPADESIRALEQQLELLGKRKRLAKVSDRLGKEYERILLDCPPVLNELSRQVVRAADLLIVPLPPSPLSTRTFEMMVREVKETSNTHPPILPVLSMVDMRRALHRQARDANPKWPAIPLASALEQSAVRQEPVGAFAPASTAALAMGRLWTAIERKLARG